MDIMELVGKLAALLRVLMTWTPRFCHWLGFGYLGCILPP